MSIKHDLHKAAITQAKARYPKGWAGAAAVRLSSGEIITSVAPDIKNEALALCMEVGTYLEAHRQNLSVTHSLCISRENENSEFLILSPCGICQERLIHWGGDVLVAISNVENKLFFKAIRELQPYHWSIVYDEKL